MRKCYRYLQIFLVIALVTSFASADNGVQAQNVPEEAKQDLKSNTYRHLKGAVDEVTGEERGVDFTKVKSLVNKTPNLSKLKTVLAKKADVSKVEIPAGQKVDLTKVKTLPRSKTDININQLKKIAEKDPDLRSISSVVGKNPTQLPAKQVEGVQSFIRKTLKMDWI